MTGRIVATQPPAQRTGAMDTLSQTEPALGDAQPELAPAARDPSDLPPAAAAPALPGSEDPAAVKTGGAAAKVGTAPAVAAEPAGVPRRKRRRVPKNVRPAPCVRGQRIGAPRCPASMRHGAEPALSPRWSARRTATSCPRPTPMISAASKRCRGAKPLPAAFAAAIAPAAPLIASPCAPGRGADLAGGHASRGRRADG